MVDIVTLPACPPPVGATLSLVSFGQDAQGPMGGPTQRVLRLGSRMRVELSWAPMGYDDARRFIARLLRAEASPVAIALPQRGLGPVSPGALAVSAAVTSSGLLAVSGGTPNLLLKEGQFFSLTAGGRRYVHNLQDDVVLDANGAGMLPLNPLLRVAPAIGDMTEWVIPILEGFPDLNSTKWTLEWLTRVGLQLAVTEDR